MINLRFWGFTLSCKSRVFRWRVLWNKYFERINGWKERKQPLLYFKWDILQRKENLRSGFPETVLGWVSIVLRVGSRN